MSTFLKGIRRPGGRTVEIDYNPDGGSQTTIVTGPIPIAFNSPGIETTGFPVLDVLAGDIVFGQATKIDTAWDNGQSGRLRVHDNTGVVTGDGAPLGLDQVGEGDAFAWTPTYSADGATLIVQDTQLVVCESSGVPVTAGAGNLWIAIFRPAS